MTIDCMLPMYVQDYYENRRMYYWSLAQRSSMWYTGANYNANEHYHSTIDSLGLPMGEGHT